MKIKSCLQMVAVLIAALSPLSSRAQQISNVEDTRKCAAFVFIEDKGEKKPIGTGFFLWSQTGSNEMRIYFVTAKHVLKNPTNDSEYLPSVALRLVVKNTGDFGYFWLPLRTNGLFRVYTHSDSAVDIAVIPIAPGAMQFDFKALPDTFLATKERLKKFGVCEGDDMFFFGLFTPFYGHNSNLPIFRFGRLAMLTDEKIPCPEGDQFLYLMETQAFGGNSGSPVMFQFSKERNPGDTKYLIAGIMKGYFYNVNEVKFVDAKAGKPVSTENTGIAIVTPAFLLDEIIHSKELDIQPPTQPPASQVATKP